VFGIVDGGISSTSNTGNGSQTTSGAVSSILGVSAIGFKGDKDLGDGLTGFFNFMAGFNRNNWKTV
jgi:predicted porin